MPDHPLDIENLLGERPRLRTASGLEVVFHGEPEPDADSPWWVMTPRGLAVPKRPPPSLLNQVVITPEESDLGLQALSEAEIRDLIQPIPIAPALVWTARRLIRLWDTEQGPAAQIGLAQQIFDPDAPVIDAFRRFLEQAESGERRVCFSEQQFHLLLRLAFESCRDDQSDRSWERDRETRMRRALLGVTSLTGEGATRIREKAESLEDWLGFFTQNGAYNSKEQPLLAYQRVFRVYVELADSEEARRHPAYLSFDELTRRHVGATLPRAVCRRFRDLRGSAGRA